MGTYRGHQRDSTSLRNWVTNSLSSTDDDFFDVVLQSDVPWVVDFYAPWCGPCQTFAFEFEMASKIMEGRVKFATVNCDRFYQSCQTASVHAYPSVRFYAGRTGLSR